MEPLVTASDPRGGTASRLVSEEQRIPELTTTAALHNVTLSALRTRPSAMDDQTVRSSLPKEVKRRVHCNLNCSMQVLLSITIQRRCSEAATECTVPADAKLELTNNAALCAVCNTGGPAEAEAECASD